MADHDHIKQRALAFLPGLPCSQLMPPERNGDYQRGYDEEDMREYALEASAAALRSAETADEPVAWRSRKSGGCGIWHYIGYDARPPDSYELRECEIDPVYLRPQRAIIEAAERRGYERGLAATRSAVHIVCDWNTADPFPLFIDAETPEGVSIALPWFDRSDGLKELRLCVLISEYGTVTCDEA